MNNDVQIGPMKLLIDDVRIGPMKLPMGLLVKLLIDDAWTVTNE